MRDQSVELLGDDGFAGVDSDLWWRKVEKRRVFNFFGRGESVVAETDIGLKRESRRSDASDQCDSYTDIALPLSNRLGGDARFVDLDAILERGSADFLEDGDEPFLRRIAEPKEVRIAGGTVDFGRPGSEQHRSLEDKSFSVRGNAQAAQEPLQRKSFQQRSVLFTALPREVEKPSQDGSFEVCRLSSGHAERLVR